MATTTKPRKRETLLAFEALAIEGGLLTPEWLTKAAQLEAGDQSEASYKIPKGLNLRDEIGRYWRIAEAHWSDFEAGRAGGADPGKLSERLVVALLRESFGFSTLAPAPPAVVKERTYPIGFAALDGRVPVVIAPAPPLAGAKETELDTQTPQFGDGSRRRSAFGLAQEFLNAEDKAMWGLACDGVKLRILRDNASLTRPAWIEADLYRIFTERRYADFAALWLLVHETRFGRPDQPVSECALEAWREKGRDEGTRARMNLRRGVEEALIALGRGFVSHTENTALRAALQTGALTKEAYFNQLLRLVYRFIFLLTVEERGLLHPEGADDKAKSLYAEGYGMRRLRERSVKRSAHDRFSDIWEAVKIVFRGLAEGEPRLGLPALAGIFAEGQCKDLDTAKLVNHELMRAIFHLSWLREKGLSRVNWRDMGPEELGSVYESLLELVPQIAESGREFTFASGAEAKGNARKTSGSYYTPDSLVQVLLDSALEPVIADAIAKHPDKPVDALLSLSVVDPACGSGHFLLAAARRLAAHVARLQANGTPSAAEYRHALRQVIGRCVYGVDLNSMAVELCKVSLWMEAVEPGLPLTFLDGHIRCGNSLLGATPALLAKGIPDEAFQPIEGDDKKIASALKKRNKAERKGGTGDLFVSMVGKASGDQDALTGRAIAVEKKEDLTLETLRCKERAWKSFVESNEYKHAAFLADAWCAAFVWPKTAEHGESAITEDLWQRMKASPDRVPEKTRAMVEQLAADYHFFHWHLAFPQVFRGEENEGTGWKGGFDCVLGNPPWDHVEIKEEEFFATSRPDISGAANAAARKTAIARLEEEDPKLFASFLSAQRGVDAETHLLRNTGRFPLCARGRINTYAVFAELNRRLIAPSGRMGCILPSGIATDDTTKFFFQDIVARTALASLFHFENEDRLFHGVHNMFRYCLLTLSGRSRPVLAPEFVAYARQASHVADAKRRYVLTRDEFDNINPNTGTLPLFRSRRDAEITKAVYRRMPVLIRDGRDDRAGVNPWGVSYRQGIFNMASDSGLFCNRKQLEAECFRLDGNVFKRASERYMPLYEAKMIHQFDHRYGTYEGQTQSQANKGFLPYLNPDQHLVPVLFSIPGYWVAATEIENRLRDRWDRAWLLGWRDICRSTDERTVIAAIVPRVGMGNTMPFMMPTVGGPIEWSCLYADLVSFVLDYSARQKIGGTHLTYNYLNQLPVLPPATYNPPSPWCASQSIAAWLCPRVLELTYTAWDLQLFARDVGYEGPPLRWDEARRFLLRAELDAAFFHLYGIVRDDVDYIMDTFPIVKRKDEKVHGEYRTKRVILEIYDEMQRAIDTGAPYQTRLDPPPADPRVAHPDRDCSRQLGK